MGFSAIAIAVGTLCGGLHPPRCEGSYHIVPLVWVRRRRQR
jgi:hypothetical protein